ncbi:centrosomal protein of 131 kDa-like [Hydractinia symbiolongicarpus]|uniref:centrosomal protein of 131 kDa-like n=1 Tax=Hydractinia symbiolongicarpus TaxID=13093 RepID=UPI00255054F3|nr:centrosomal protein of 131 kDa-like [Hydractinia symbiolongicarpus]
MAAQEEKSQTRIDLSKLWSHEGGPYEESIEERYRREKDEMLQIIIEKTMLLNKLEEEYEKELERSKQLSNALKKTEKDLKEKDATLKKFQKNHSNLLWEVSREQNERWLIKNQTNTKKKNTASETWHQIREDTKK